VKVFAFAVVMLFTVTVKAQEFPAPSHEIILWSARACYAEATWSQPDCTALLNVIRKRSEKSGWAFLRMLKEYSVHNWVHSAQGKLIKRFHLGTHKGRDKDWNRNWQTLVNHVVDVLNMRIDDPCPRANHWAAKWYKPKSPMRRVQCEIATANAFWVGV
jgi:hypothetical protein